MTSRSNSQFVVASVTEFLSVWALGGKAALNLTTSDGLATVGFNCTLGHPGAPHSIPAFSPPPSPPTSYPPRRPRHRGPAQREKNRLRAARHQATQAKTAAPVSTSPSSMSATVPVTSHSITDPVTLTDKITSNISSFTEKDILEYKCDQCDYESISGKGLRQHIRMKHQISQVDGAEDIEQELKNHTVTEKIEDSSQLIVWNHETVHLLNEILLEPPARLYCRVKGIGIYEFTCSQGSYFYKFEDGESIEC